jgi:hypothetical protein
VFPINVVDGGVSILQWLRDLIKIYTWWEIWLLAGIPTAIVAVWVLFSYLLEIQNTIARSASIWTLLLLLMFGAATVDALRKQRTK